MAHQAPAPESKPAGEHKPFVPAEQEMAEFTPKAVILGSIFGLIFGMATVYLALKAGLTVSASIPIAVLSIAVFKKIGSSTILENNIVQTIGSAGESIAAGVAFTVPALLFLPAGKGYFEYFQIMTLAAVGGILGVLFMIPLRRALIVNEHGNLPYPEGTACADVLVAGERGGTMAKAVFSGVGVAVLYKVLYAILGLWKEIPRFVTGKKSALPNATLAGEISPEYLGVGYIIGPRIGGIMVSGGVLSWIVLIPLLSLFVPEAQIAADLTKLGKDPGMVEANMPRAIYEAYIRYIGAGAVAMAGFMTLLRTMPTILSALRDSLKTLKGGVGGGAAKRTERDIPITWVGLGSVALLLLIALLPKIPHGPLPWSFVMALLVMVFGFIFVTVSSRIVGIIGSSSNPISGMTIATLMGTCLVFISLGMTGDAYGPVALCVGAIVCIAAANAGATSQDLKTGFLVGATPKLQQIGLMIGVLVSTLAIGFTINLLNNSTTYGPIGENPRLPAPQATLMATLIKGLLAQQLPWAYILIGAGLAVMVQLCGVSGLAWAVGAYLPISTTSTIFAGGVVRWLADKIRGKAEESEVSSGMLFSTGLVAGGSLAGVAIVALTQWETARGWAHWGEAKQASLGGLADVIALAAFGVLCTILVRKALKKLEI